jgi:hypothetical protein
LQLGPDGKIYVVKSFNQFLGVVNSPNTAGAACNYVEQGLDLDPNFMGQMSSLGLPTMVQSFLNNAENCVVNSIASETTDNTVEIYPNPSTTNFTVETGNDFSEVTIKDYTGKIISSRKLSAAVNKLEMSENLPAGIYFISVKTSSGTITKRIIRTDF